MTQHTCAVTKALSQCTCGQWYDNGKAIAAFVARALQEKRDAALEAVINWDNEQNVDRTDVVGQFQQWVKRVHHDMFTSCPRLHAHYWDHRLGKSYVAVGVLAQPPMIAYQGTGMYLPNGVFCPDKTLRHQSLKWTQLMDKRQEHGYSTVHKFVSEKEL